MDTFISDLSETDDKNKKEENQMGLGLMCPFENVIITKRNEKQEPSF